LCENGKSGLTQPAIWRMEAHAMRHENKMITIQAF